MRRFAVEVLVYSATLGLITAIGTRIQVPQPFPFGGSSAPVVELGAPPVAGLLALGASIAVADRLLRPVLEALTGRWLLATMGLFSFVISTVSLWLASALVHGIGLQFASPGFLWLAGTAVVFSVVAGLSRVVLGLDRVAIDRDGRGHALWRVLDRLPTPRRNVLLENVRLRQVYGTLTSTVIDVGLEGSRVGSFREWFRLRVLGLPVPPAGCQAPRRIRMMLEDLGPTYVKLGQMAAVRIEALPISWRTELARLNASASPFPWPDACRIIQADLGRSPKELFATIDHVPFAAASTAQVHRATLHDGRAVAVKIQRPRIAATTKADLGVLIQLASVAEQRFSLARKLGARGVVAEFARSVLDELDYRNEAYNARRLADAMARFPDVHVPLVHRQLSGEHVLTEEFIGHGVRLSETDKLRAAGLDSATLGATLVRAMIRQILIDGFFHADPHDGNVLADRMTGKIVFLDMGQMGSLTRAQRLELLGLIHAVKSVDIGGIADSLLALSVPIAPFDERRFRADIDRIARESLVYGDAGSLGAAIGRLMASLLDNGLRLDTELAMAIKAMTQTEATARHLSPDLDLAQIAITETTIAIRESLEPDQVRKRAEAAAVHVGKELARRLPTVESAALKWFDMFSQGRIKVELDTSDLERSFAHAGNVGRQATVGVIVVGQLIGTAIVMGTLLQPALGEFQLFGVFAMASFALSLVVSFLVLRRVLSRADSGSKGR